LGFFRLCVAEADPVAFWHHGRRMGQIQWGIRLGVGVLAGALLGSACASPNHAQTVNVVQASATAMAKNQTVEIDATMTEPHSSATTSRMVYDYQHHLGETLPSPGPSGQELPLVIYDGSTIYVNISTFLEGLPGSTKLPAGKKWLAEQIPGTTQANNPLSNLFDPMFPAGDMATFLDRLAPVVQSVRQAGTAVIGGVQTTRYDVTLDPQAVQSLFAGEPQAPFELSGSLQLWVDSQDRVRQVQFSLSVPQLGQVTQTLDYSHFGLPVHISVPPANEVESPKQFMQSVQNVPNNGFCSFSTPTSPSGQSGPGVAQVCSASASSGGMSAGGTGSGGLLTPSQP
jgi:hypothetical protein